MMDHLVEPSSGTRRAALTLHALGGVDRAWLLRQLSPGQRDTMASLLAELDSLGIPRDSALVQDALASTLAPVAPRPADLDAEGLCRALAREPDRDFQSLWLNAMDATERKAILAHWALPLEPRPRLAGDAADWSPALREAVRQGWLEASREMTP
jgi:hypothetical protein